MFQAGSNSGKRMTYISRALNQVENELDQNIIFVAQDGSNLVCNPSVSVNITGPTVMVWWNPRRSCGLTFS